MQTEAYTGAARIVNPMSLEDALYMVRLTVKGNEGYYETPDLLIRAAELIEAEEPAELGIVDTLYDECPWLADYDAQGNYVGPVANENGWTA